MSTKADSAASAQQSGGIFTIPPTAPFFDALARAILNGDLPRSGGLAPTQLQRADTLVYVPNRVACRALKSAFLRACADGATLLPRIRPLGGAEEDALLILHGAEEDDPRLDLPVPPAIGALERRMVLTRLILAWADRLKRGQIAGDRAMRIAETPAAASELALGLMRLMDEADTETVDLRNIRAVLPERFAAHEQLSLSFLEIVLDAWPRYLAEGERLNPMQRRNRVMALEAARLLDEGADKPVIIAGSFGSIPATAALMKAVHSLPRGAIVLPGAEIGLDDAAWNAIADHPEHPQASAMQLLTGLGACRADIVPLPGQELEPQRTARMRFLSEALRPSSTAAGWHHFIAAGDAEAIRESLKSVSLITASTEHDEAATIALILREAAETPGKTASLVTPDRLLARRVRAQLGKWGLLLPDTAGSPLAATPHGIFYQLIADAAATGSRIAILGLLKHPLMRLGLAAGEAQSAAQIIEMAAIRQPWCGDGAAALGCSLQLTRNAQRKHRALERLSDAEWQGAEEVSARFAEALRPLTERVGAKAMSLALLAGRHKAVAEILARDETGAAPALPADAGAEPMCAFMEALCSDVPGPALQLADYPALFRSLIQLETCAETPPSHPRLAILGPREARLASADTVIIAGLNEGTWPQAADPGPWLNRTTRGALGLPPPERSTSLAAHDFWQLMGAPQVILTRALKCEGTPTLPSRWLMRIEALLSGLGLSEALEPKRPWLHWALDGQQTPSKAAAKAPAPCPPVGGRPRQLSVADIASLMANPYAIYAKHILRLAPLDPLDGGPGGGERGRIIHETLHRFARRFRNGLPDDCGAQLLAIFDDCASHYGDHARIAAFWRPRLERFSRWFAETEAERRAGAQIHAEVRGELTIDAPAGPITLRAWADRIDVRADGSLAIYDYKSGSMPPETDVLSFKAPQLPLAALIAMEGKFKNIDSRKVGKLAYISAKGGEPAGEELALTKQEPDALAKAARDGLLALLTRFDDAATPYTAMRRGGFANGYRFDAYAHLARVEAWSGVSEEG